MTVTRAPTGQDLICLVCHKPAQDIDHVVNRGMGGSKERDVPENKVPLCRECHELKTVGHIETEVGTHPEEGLSYRWRKKGADIWIGARVEVSQRYKCLVPVLSAAAEGGTDSKVPSGRQEPPGSAEVPAPLEARSEGQPLAAAPSAGLTHEQRVAIAQDSTASKLPALLDALSRAVDEAQTVPALKSVRDRAEAIRKWAKSAGAGLQAQNWIADKKIVCERKAGDLLAQDIPHQGGRKPLHDASVLRLADMGIGETQSHRWQREASVEEGEYRAYVQTCDETETELTSAGVLRLAYALIERPPLTDPAVGTYRTVIIDPPWPMQKIEREVRPKQGQALDYAVKSVDEIAAWKAQNFMAEDGCHVYLWTTQRFLEDAMRIMEGWGVRRECVLVWNKNVGITPYSWMYNAEFVLFGRVGNLPLLKNGEKVVFDGKVREHSRKPDEFYDLVRLVSPEPRIDVFSREAREGFEQWGDEKDRFELP